MGLLTTGLIQRGGSKLETTRLIVERGIPIPVPRSLWLYQGQRLDPLVPELQKMLAGGGNLIVRGSHPSDYHWSIDAIHTERGVFSIDGVEKAIKKIEAGVRSEDFKIHCADGGEPYSEEVHVLIQQQLKSPVLGSMLRHPNIGTVHLECRDTSKNRYTDGLDATIREINVSSADIGAEWYGGFGLPISVLVNDIYGAFEESGIPDMEFVQQVEFGSPGLFLQARPAFRKISKQAFDIDTEPFSKIPHIYSSCVFGVTSSQGVEFDFTSLEEESIGGFRNDGFSIRSGSIYDVQKNGYYPGKPLPQEPYGLFLLSALTKSPSIRYRLGCLEVFVSFFNNDFGHYLEHSSYRFMKKAKLSFIGSELNNCERDSLNKEFGKCTVFSNGREGMIVPSKYL